MVLVLRVSTKRFNSPVGPLRGGFVDSRTRGKSSWMPAPVFAEMNTAGRNPGTSTHRGCIPERLPVLGGAASTCSRRGSGRGPLRAHSRDGGVGAEHAFGGIHHQQDHVGHRMWRRAMTTLSFSPSAWSALAPDAAVSTNT